jgi:hypothetical protein
MLTDFPDQRWQAAGLAKDLMVFACLPSINLHPSRIDSLLPPSARQWLSQLTERSTAWQQLHRLWSGDMCRSMALPALNDCADPALVLALLPLERWQALQQLAGVTLLAAHIRRCIGRADVAVLNEVLGAGVYRFALRQAPHVPKGAPVPAALSVADAQTQCLSLGEACVARALLAASAPVARRAALRLPVSAIEAAADPAWADLPPQGALNFCNALTHHMDPTWLSSFPATR